MRLITAVISFCCFLLFLIAFLNPEGMLIRLFEALVLSMIGQVGFYVAIPALLYLFVIQAFSGKRPVILRSVCLLCFVLICGCISQVIMLGQDGYHLPNGFDLVNR